jgi:S-methylmethionine-dependent homocysteine/selenocysteine methylase
VNTKHLLLDGATGTELNRRGLDTGLPLWSANALTTDSGLSVLREVHLDYLNAGADIITTNTFRTNHRALIGKGFSARELTLRAVATAREAIDEFGKPALVAGSVSSLEDCYRPDLVPSADECLDEHTERIEHLVEGGVDLLLIETMNSIREAVIATKIATATGLPTWVTFVCNKEGRILSGESLIHAADLLMPLRVKALGVNCMPAHTIAQPLKELYTICGEDFPLVAYGNIGYVDDEQGWINTDATDPASYLIHAQGWPAKIIGACCGSTPQHIRKLKQSWKDLSIC